MFDNVTKDRKIVNEYINYNLIDRNNIHILRYNLSAQDNPKEFLVNFFKDIKQGSIAVITETIVYDEDAYLNAAVSQADDKHRRFYTVNEIIDMTKDYARLNYFFNFNEEVLFDNMLKHLSGNDKMQKMLKIFNDFPDNIKDLLSFKYENGNLVSFTPNNAVFIMTKK